LNEEVTFFCLFVFPSLTYVTRYVGVKRSVLEDSDHRDVTPRRGVNRSGCSGGI